MAEKCPGGKHEWLNQYGDPPDRGALCDCGNKRWGISETVRPFRETNALQSGTKRPVRETNVPFRETTRLE